MAWVSDRIAHHVASIVMMHLMGSSGSWWGLVIGLAIVAVLLLTRARRALKSDVARIAMH